MQWFRAWQERRFLIACERRGVVLMSKAQCLAIMDWQLAVEAFCHTSGSVQNGCYPVGRHAVRKIRAMSRTVLSGMIVPAGGLGLTLH